MEGRATNATLADATSEARAPADSQSAVSVNPLSPARAALLLAVAAGLGVFTGLALFSPAIPVAALAPGVPGVSDTIALVAAAGIALLAWVRYREMGETDALFQATAFLTLLAAGLVPVVDRVIGLPQYDGFDYASPGQAPLYMWLVSIWLAATLVLLGAISSRRQWSVGRRGAAWLGLLAPALAMVGVSLVLVANDAALPPIIAAERLSEVVVPSATFDPGRLNVVWALAHLVPIAFLVRAAWVYVGLPGARARGRTVVLASALLVGAFALIHYAVVPGVYARLFSSGEFLLPLFYVLVFASLAIGVRDDLSDLNAANRALARLHEVDTRRAAIEERAHLAREIHDGLVQELWLARLTQGRLMAIPALPEEARVVVRRLDRILEDALAEARQAVVTLQPGTDDSFADLLRRLVEDYAARFGLEVRTITEGELYRLPTETQNELIRICREALTNASKHADAPLVRVHLAFEGDTLRLTVSDNGVGFDVGAVRGGFGLRSMRERARRMGGQLAIASAPMDGTRVMVELKLRRIE